MEERRLQRIAFAAALALCAALVVAPALVHFDDSDSQLYQVLIRHLARGRAWLDLRYLPGAYPEFREHLPFGFWPDVVAVRAFGEGALPWVASAWTLATLALLGWAASRLWDPWAGPAAVLLLGTMPSFFLFGSRPLLEPPLLFFVSASVVPLLFPEVRLRHWAIAAGCAAAAAAVKGPLGIAPLSCAAAARAWVRKSPATLLTGVGASLAAALPVAGFLLWDRGHGGTWWSGYFQGQLLATMQGTRDTIRPPWFPTLSVAGRMWLALPFAAFALWRRPSEATRACAGTVALLLVALALPQRKMWTHALIAYPPLALLGAAGAGPLLAKMAALRPRLVPSALGAVAALAWAAAALGAGRWVTPPPCPSSRELAACLDPLPPGTKLCVVAPDVAWSTIANLAAERDLEPSPCAMLPASGWALIQDGSAPSGGWTRCASGRGWTVVHR